MAGDGWPTGERGESDRIVLTGLTFYGYHGVHPEERALGQRFVVDLALDLDLRPAGESDDLAKTASYSEVYRVVREVVEGPPRNLLEAVAEGIARDVLRASGARGVRVRLTKPWAPIKGSTTGTAAVEIYRRP
jgi:7,8-dihydroneopterin aldolase/epimerase/oxygenase